MPHYKVKENKTLTVNALKSMTQAVCPYIANTSVGSNSTFYLIVFIVDQTFWRVQHVNHVFRSPYPNVGHVCAGFIYFEHTKT